jgi:hypothetical protein
MTQRPFPESPFPLLPLRSGVLLPEGGLTLTVGRPRSLALIEGLKSGSLFGVVTQRDPKVEEPVPADFHAVGTIARLSQIVRVPGSDALRITVEGLGRFAVDRVTSYEPFLQVEGAQLADERGADKEAKVLGGARRRRPRAAPPRRHERGAGRGQRHPHVPRVDRRDPVAKRAEVKDDIDAVRSKLDDDHTGLKDVKKRILEHMAVLKLAEDPRGTILCLVGPPGRGQDLLGQSSPTPRGALRAHRPRRRARRGRDPRPPAHVRGRPAGPHRAGHEEGEGNQPGHAPRRGRQARATGGRLARVGPARGARPRAEHTFTDHYMELPFDLSEAMFICTANTSTPSRRRCATAWRSSRSRATPPTRSSTSRGTTSAPQLKEHGLTTEGRLDITDAAAPPSSEHYTREAGVRTAHPRDRRRVPQPRAAHRVASGQACTTHHRQTSCRA